MGDCTKVADIKQLRKSEEAPPEEDAEWPSEEDWPGEDEEGLGN